MGQVRSGPSRPRVPQGIPARKAALNSTDARRLSCESLPNSEPAHHVPMIDGACTLQQAVEGWWRKTDQPMARSAFMAHPASNGSSSRWLRVPAEGAMESVMQCGRQVVPESMPHPLVRLPLPWSWPHDGGLPPDVGAGAPPTAGCASVR